MRRQGLRSLVLGVLALAAIASAAQAQGPVKIAYVDPLSGAFAATGENGLNQFRFAADQINRAGGVLGRITLEVASDDETAHAVDNKVYLQIVAAARWLGRR